jgi:hypothetical protein
MQFLMTITIGRNPSAPSLKFQTAMTKLVDDGTAAGTFILSGGLAPSSQGRRLTLARGELTLDEPIGEQRGIDGFAVLEAPSLDEAFQKASQLMQLHQLHTETWVVECAVRPIVTHCLP